ncbi:hypothetical protein ABTN81_20065, partial [Acinetobacter baumannii]
HFFQLSNSELPNGIRDGDTNPGVILVVADALEFYMLIVQKEPLVRIESKRPKTALRDDLIHQMPTYNQRSLNLI